MKERIDRVILLFAACMVIACGVRYHQSGLSLLTDIESLVPSLPQIQDKESVRFLLNDSRKKELLKKRLVALVAFSTTSISALEEVCRAFAPYRGTFLDASAMEVLQCRPVNSCLRNHLQRALAEESFVGAFLLCDPLLLSVDPLVGVFRSLQDRDIVAGTVKSGVRAKDIEHAVDLFEQEFPGSEVVWSGYIRFSDSSRSRFEKEFRFIGTISTLCIVIALLVVFRSFSCVFVAFTSSLFGFLMGVITCLALKGEIHGLTLSLGGSVLGACVDYSIHWFSERFWSPGRSADEMWKRTSPVIRLGMYTSICALFPFVFTDSILLREFLYFCIGALSGSYCLLSCTFLMKSTSTGRWSYELSYSLCRSVRSCGRSPLFVLLLAMLALSGFFFVHSNDDISLLQQPLPHLVANEKKLAQGGVPTAHLVIRRGNEEQMTSSLLKVLEMIQAHPEIKLPVSFSLPSREQQDASYAAYTTYIDTFSHEIAEVAEEFGIEYSAKSRDLRRLDLEFFRLLVPQLFSQQGDVVVPVVGWREGVALPDSVAVVDYRKTITEIFSQYRREGIIALIGGYLIIAALFAVRERHLRGVLCVLPCIVTGVVTISLLGILGVPATFFTMMALALVLGLTADYAVFFLESEGFESASLSVVLSTATTVGAFLPLLFSDTNLLFGVGLTLVVGVLAASLVSPLVLIVRRS